MTFNLFDEISSRSITPGASLFPSIKPRRKVFISYHHANDQAYKVELERILGTTVIHKSVGIGDISTDVSHDYIATLVRDDFLRDASVCIVLIGSETFKRKHVDWEIAAALDKKVGGYSGLIGILLPTHPDYQQPNVHLEKTPLRIYRNFESGFAKCYSWTNNQAHILARIETAFESRTSLAHKIKNRSIPQMVNNRY